METDWWLLDRYIEIRERGEGGREKEEGGEQINIWNENLVK